MACQDSQVHNSADSLHFLLSLGLVFWTRLCDLFYDLFVSQNTREFCVSHSPEQILGYYYYYYCYYYSPLYSILQPCAKFLLLLLLFFNSMKWWANQKFSLHSDGGEEWHYPDHKNFTFTSIFYILSWTRLKRKVGRGLAQTTFH